MSQKTVLLTGATGLLGKHILIDLIQQDYEIFAVKRFSSPIPNGSKKINWIEIDSIENNVFERISKKIDFVIHAAALVSYKRADRARIFKVNTDWTVRLATDAREANVNKFTFVSSISALGQKSATNRINEETPKSKNEDLTNYGESKRKAESFLWQLSDKGLPINIFNPSVIIGPAKRYQSSAQLFAYVSDQKPFYTTGIINYIDVRDVAKIIVKSLESTIVNEQFVLSAGSTSYKEFFGAIAQKLKVKPPFLGVPKFLVIFGALLENLVSLITKQPATLTLETAKMAGNKRIYAAEKAETIFKIPFTNIDQSIDYTVKEMKKDGEL